MLVFGTAGLVTVRFSNPRLRGLGWLAGAFAAGGIGALLLLLESRSSSLLAGTASDLTVLLAFVLLHCAVLDLLEHSRRVPGFGLWLMGLEGLAHALMGLTSASGQMRIVVIGLVMAAQVTQTAVVLVQRMRYGMRAAMWFNAGILACFAALNVSRSVAVMSGVMRTHVLPILQTVTFLEYLARRLAWRSDFSG